MAFSWKYLTYIYLVQQLSAGMVWKVRYVRTIVSTIKQDLFGHKSQTKSIQLFHGSDLSLGVQQVSLFLHDGTTK